jgi:hypothetical protein
MLGRLFFSALSCVKIGVPLSVFVKRESNATGGSRWQTADGKATLDTISLPAGGETLQQLYDRAIVSGNPNRKVTYKLLRPDFFVVTGETPTGRFYRRMTLGPDGTMRGFSLGFDKALTTEMDRLTISIANSFEAFPQVASATTAAGQAAAVAAAVAAAAPSIPTMATTHRERLGSGLLVESGQVLTAIVVLKDCKAITIGARRVPARVLASDAQTGLGLLRAEGLMRTGPGLATAPIPAAGGTLTMTARARKQTDRSVAQRSVSPSTTVSDSEEQRGFWCLDGPCHNLSGLPALLLAPRHGVRPR